MSPALGNCHLNVTLIVQYTVHCRGYHGDLNETIFVGEVSDKARDLVANTWECLEKAISECVKPGTKYREVGMCCLRDNFLPSVLSV